MIWCSNTLIDQFIITHLSTRSTSFSFPLKHSWILWRNLLPRLGLILVVLLKVELDWAERKYSHSWKANWKETNHESCKLKSLLFALWFASNLSLHTHWPFLWDNNQHLLVLNGRGKAPTWSLHQSSTISVKVCSAPYLLQNRTVLHISKNGTTKQKLILQIWWMITFASFCIMETAPDSSVCSTENCGLLSLLDWSKAVN